MPNMANGTQTQTPAKGGKLQFKPGQSAGAPRPTIPEGKWLDSLMPRGKFKVTATKNGEPMVSIPVKLGRADNPDNESYQGAEDVIRVVFYSDEDATKIKAANFAQGRLRAICEAADVDYDTVYPKSWASEDDFDDLIHALEGKKLPELWTYVKEDTMPSGEKRTNTEFSFREPGSGLMKGNTEDEDEAPKGKGGKTAKRR